MSQYKMLVDHYISNQVLSAGSIQSTADSGGVLPSGWSPSPNCDPQDNAALSAFYAAGVASVGFRWANYSFSNGFAPTFLRLVVPITYFKPTPLGKTYQWVLQGLGINLAPLVGS